jgi:hypothetical protein
LICKGVEVYWCGSPLQAITSAGTGAMAALDAERWLSEQGFCSKAS